MKKIIIVLITALLLLTGCNLGSQSEEDVLQNEGNQRVETSIVPANRLGEDTYRMILPYKTSEARGVIVNQVTNRMDIDEMEEGLRHHSTDVFNPETLYFQEGNYLSETTVLRLIGELNPERQDDWTREDHANNPRTLSHILEQNYLKQNDDNTVSVAGVSIGIALKSVYSFNAPKDGPAYTSDIPLQDMLETGYRVAEEVVNELIEMDDFPDVPILIGLYREQEANSPIPGNFVAKTVVEPDTTAIGDWETIDEEYMLFPSSEASSTYPSDAEVYNNFTNKIGTFFPNYVGAVGQGFYSEGELERLSIEIPIEFYGKAEVIGFTQYVYGIIQEIFPSYYHLEVIITSSNGVESFIERQAGDEQLYSHIFH